MRRLVRLARASYDRYRELHGGELASAVTLAAFLSLLPLLVVGVAVIGYVSAASSEDLAQQAIQELGLSGKAADTLTTAMEQAQASRKAATLVGLAGLLWTGLGVVRALQHTWDTAWQVPGRGFRGLFLGLAWLAGAGIGFVGSFTLSAASQLLPWFLAPLGVLAGFATGVALWLWTARILPNRNVGWRPLLPAAVVGALGFELLKVLGGWWVPRLVASSSALYGSLGVVFAVLTWLLLFGRLVAFSAMVEVVLWEDRHGTVEVTIDVPARPGFVPVAATRAGEQKFESDGRNGPMRLWENLKERAPTRG